MGNLGLNTLVDAVDVAEQTLWEESLLELLTELLVISDDSDVLRGLSVPTFPGVSGVEDTS